MSTGQRLLNALGDRYRLPWLFALLVIAALYAKTPLSVARFDLLLQVAAPSTAALDEVLDRIGQMSGVKSSESLIHLSTRIDRAV